MTMINEKKVVEKKNELMKFIINLLPFSFFSISLFIISVVIVVFFFVQCLTKISSCLYTRDKIISSLFLSFLLLSLFFCVSSLDCKTLNRVLCFCYVSYSIHNNMNETDFKYLPFSPSHIYRGAENGKKNHSKWKKGLSAFSKFIHLCMRCALALQ